MPQITVRAIETARSKDKAYQLQADRGLYLNVNRNGTKTWSVRFSLNGKQHYAALVLPYGLGAGEMSLAEACEENARIQGLARKGIDFREYDKAKEKKILEEQALIEVEKLTFGELFETWLSDGVQRKDDNAELRRMFTKDVLPSISKKHVADITEKDIRDLLKKIVKRGANRIAVRIYNDLVQLFKWAEARQPWRKLLIEGIPTSLIDIRQIISPEYENLKGLRTRFLDENEIRELHTILKNTTKEYELASYKEKRGMKDPLSMEYQFAIWICLSTLCRIGELLVAEWKHVNFKTGEWLIPKENVKSTRGTKQDLLVFLSPFALEQFKALHYITGSTNWLFPDKSGASHIDIKNVGRQINDRQIMFKERKAGVESKRKYDNSFVLANGEKGDWTPHDLRRTGATMMQKLEIDPAIIDCCQNHVLNSGNGKVRRHYQLYDYAREKKAAWLKWGEYLEKILQ